MKLKYKTYGAWCETFCPNSEKAGIKIGSLLVAIVNILCLITNKIENLNVVLF